MAAGARPEETSAMTPAEAKILEDYLEEQVELRLAQRKEGGT